MMAFSRWLLASRTAQNPSPSFWLRIAEENDAGLILLSYPANFCARTPQDIFDYTKDAMIEQVKTFMAEVKPAFDEIANYPDIGQAAE